MYLSDTITSSLQGVCTLCMCVCIGCCAANQLSDCLPYLPGSLLPPSPFSARRNALCLLLAHLVYLICLLPCALCARWPIEFRVFFCCSSPGGRVRCLGSSDHSEWRCYLRDTFWCFWLLACLPIKMTFAPVGPERFPVPAVNISD